MEVKIYDYLSEDAMLIRKEVFIDEQGFNDEYDDIDKIAFHIVMYDNEKPIATCRIFETSEKENFILGRLAVIKDYRGMNYGSRLLKEAEDFVLKNSGSCLSLHAQLRVKDFYKKNGYCEFGYIEYEEDCPHIWMNKLIVG